MSSADFYIVFAYGLTVLALAAYVASQVKKKQTLKRKLRDFEAEA